MKENGRYPYTGNSRHIDLRYFFSKDQVDKKEISIKHCPTINKCLSISLQNRYKVIGFGSFGPF